MDWLFRQLDSTPKRVLAASVLSLGIVLAVTTFAQSSYLQTRKVQIESEAGKHCAEWRYDKSQSETTVTCARFSK